MGIDYFDNKIVIQKLSKHYIKDKHMHFKLSNLFLKKWKLHSNNVYNK